MLNPYSNWNSEMTKPSREMYGVVELVGSTSSTFKPDGKLVSIKWEKTPANGKFFGYSVAQKAEVILNNYDNSVSVSKGQKFIVKMGAASNKTNLVSSPVFTINEINEDTTAKKITLTGYDLLTDASNHTVDELDLTALPATFGVGSLMEKIAQTLGTSYRYLNSTKNIQIEKDKINWEEKQLLRSAIDMLAEYTGTIVYLDNQNRLTFKVLSSTPAYNITKDNYFTYNKKEQKQLTQLTNANDLGNNVSVGTESGANQTLFNNCFLTLLEDTVAVQKMNDILAMCGNMVYTPYSLDWRGNPAIEVGDLVGIGGSGSVYYIGETLTYNGGLTAQADMIDEKFEKPISNPATIGEALNHTTAVVDKVNKEITLVVSDTAQNKEDISQLKIDTNGIDTTVKKHTQDINDVKNDVSQFDSQITTNKTDISQLKQDSQTITAKVESNTETITKSSQDADEKITTLSNKVDAQMTSEQIDFKIQSAINDGVNKVETSTGYTFDDEGLSISKSGSPLTTTITDNGMTIKDNSNEVLIANNAGVDAKNLHATTYLIIGNNSRFEDWGNRTACFWIGG